MLVELADQRIGPGRVKGRPGQLVEGGDDADVLDVGGVPAAEDLREGPDVAGTDVPGGLASGTTNGTSSGFTRSASRLTCGSRNTSAEAVRYPTTAAAAATDPGAGGRSLLSPSPIAAPAAGPSRTFCGRRPSAPAAAPAAVATGSGPAPDRRLAAQPSGAARAPLMTMRDHRAGISPGRCVARASASAAPSPAAPASAPAAVAALPRREVRAAPASAPIAPATAIC